MTELLNKIFLKKRMLSDRSLKFKCPTSGNFHIVTVIITARKKTISIKVIENKIIINTPYFVDDSYILSLLDRKKNWISKNLLSNTPEFDNILKNGQAYYLGKIYRINIKKGSQNTIIINKNNLELTYNRENIKFKNILKKWYKKKCFYLLKDRINFFSKKMNVECKGFFIRSYKRRLGSCDIKSRISFNWKLIFLPINVIDYVVIHELCHIIHFNHSKLFWSKVSQHCPKYKEHKKWITKNFNILKF